MIDPTAEELQMSERRQMYKMENSDLLTAGPSIPQKYDGL